ncbi:MAG: LPS export ABC transporter periplasmic protein LptC [Bacteroidia bacterium]
MILVKHIQLLLSVAIIALLSVSCETDRNEIMALGKKTVMPDLTGSGVTMLYSDSTILKIKLQTPQMQKYEKNVKEPVTIMPKGLYVIFYDEKGKEATTLKADYGVRYEKSKRMEVKYNVEVVNVNGEKLNTEHLIWDEQRKKIISDKFVKITTAKEIIMGNGLEANQDFTQYEIKEITGSIRIDDSNL